MSRLHFLRKPLKLVLIVVLMALLSAAMLFFCLQSHLDGLVMEHSMKATAYVGTIYSRLQEYPMLKDIPEDILNELADSETVEDIMVASVHSARAEGLACVVDCFGITESLDKKLFVEGIVSDDTSLYPGAFGMKEETVYLDITSIWGGSWPYKGIMVWIERSADVATPELRKGDHVFLVGRYNFDANGNADGLIVYDPEILETLKFETDSAIWNNSIFVLPENISKEESDAQIDAFLRETGMDESCAMMGEIRDMFTVYEVEDMSMLPSVADETTFMTAGRELSEEDAGSYVCVISEALAEQNGLTVGDSIRLSIADDCYIYSSDFEEYQGWKSGYPFEGDTLLEYNTCGEFEIIGLYSEISRGIGTVDYTHHSRNDIFIPGGILPDSAAGAQARLVTFRVLGPDYEDFMDAFEVPLNEQGYTLNVIDTGWESVSSSFYAMSDRKAVMTACTIVAFIAATLSYGVLLSNHFRYEYALRRLLGAGRGEAREIYICAFAVTAIPACLAAMGCSYGAYILWIKGQVSAETLTVVPTNGEVLAYLALWTAGEMAAAFALLMLLSRIVNRQSLISLLRQGASQ